MKKTAAIIPAKGIGDALLMMIASHQLLKKGYQVTTYHPYLSQLKSWFPQQHSLKESYSLEELASFDLVIAENDNSKRIQELKYFFNQKSSNALSLFYPTYTPSKNGPLFNLDQTFLPHLPMADNIALAIARLLNSKDISKDNGLAIPEGLVHRFYKERIVIHPTSSDARKNWPVGKFLKLAELLKERGFEPVFTVSPTERESWLYVEEKGISVPLFESLDELAHFLYESAYVIGNDSVVGHLASNLQIPTLIISNNRERMRLWRPGWLPGEILTPPEWVPNFKFLRIRERYWHAWITPKHALKQFERMQALRS
jgi:hypothetical protein